MWARLAEPYGPTVLMAVLVGITWAGAVGAGGGDSWASHSNLAYLIPATACLELILFQKDKDTTTGSGWLSMHTHIRLMAGWRLLVLLGVMISSFGHHYCQEWRPDECSASKALTWREVDHAFAIYAVTLLLTYTVPFDSLLPLFLTDAATAVASYLSVVYAMGDPYWEDRATVLTAVGALTLAWYMQLLFKAEGYYEKFLWHDLAGQYKFPRLLGDFLLAVVALVLVFIVTYFSWGQHWVDDHILTFTVFCVALPLTLQLVMLAFQMDGLGAALAQSALGQLYRRLKQHMSWTVALALFCAVALAVVGLLFFWYGEFRDVQAYHGSWHVATALVATLLLFLVRPLGPGQGGASARYTVSV